MLDASGESQKILVVGANGFIGSAVSEALADGEWPVARAAREEGPGLEVLDATKYDQTIAVLEKIKPSIIVNAAGVVQNNESASLNVTMTMNLLRAAKELNLPLHRFIVSGSAAVYGHVSSLPVSEEVPVAPFSEYGKFKAEEERQALDFGAVNGIDVVVTRIFNPIGKGMNGRQLIPSIIRQLQSGASVIEVSRADSIRDYLDVLDVAAGFAALLKADRLAHTVYNLGSGVATSNEELIRFVCQALKVKKPTIRETQIEPEQQVASQADISRMVEELGWRPTRNIKSTIEEIIA